MMRSKRGSERKAQLFCIVGAIGSGKSTVSEILSERYLVQDADRMAGEVVSEKHEALRARYGDDLFDGDVLRKDKFSDKLFQSAEERAFVADLVNGEVLSRIERAANQWMEKQGKQPLGESSSFGRRMNPEGGGQKQVCFAEITAPSADVFRFFDGILVVSVKKETALRRTDSRSSAWSREKRANLYDIQRETIERAIREAGYEKDGKPVYRVDNNGSVEELRTQVEALF